MKKFEYLEKILRWNFNFLDEIKNIFHNFLRTIIRRKKKTKTVDTSFKDADIFQISTYKIFDLVVNLFGMH